MEPVSPLTNMQLELLKLFKIGVSSDELKELKSVISNFYAQKAITEADRLWDERRLTQDDMENWLREPS